MIRHKQITKLDPEFVEKKLQEFFNEDNISEDITTNTTQQASKTVEAHFIAKEDMVFAGKEIIKQGFNDCFIITIKNFLFIFFSNSNNFSLYRGNYFYIYN